MRLGLVEVNGAFSSRSEKRVHLIIPNLQLSFSQTTKVTDHHMRRVNVQLEPLISRLRMKMINNYTDGLNNLA